MQYDCAGDAGQVSSLVDTLFEDVLTADTAGAHEQTTADSSWRSSDGSLPSSAPADSQRRVVSDVNLCIESRLIQ